MKDFSIHSIGFLMLLLLTPSLNWACGCGKGYKYYYLILNSGTNETNVKIYGQKLSLKTAHPFLVEGNSIEERQKACNNMKKQCLLLLTSDDEPIGSAGFTQGQPEKPKTYAVVFPFHSFDSKKNKSNAMSSLRNMKKFEKSAYIKEFEACNCE